MESRRILPVLVALALLALPAATSAASEALAACPSDINGSGVVDGADLGYLLGAWGTNDPAADFNGDGVVGCFDQEYLLGNWGKCPCTGDLNKDRVVNSTDLAILLGTWGLDCRFDLDQNGTADGNDADALNCLWGTSGPLGDFNGDGTVNGIDLGQVLGASGQNCSGDLNHDGTVNGVDQGILLAHWGRCP